MAVFKVKFHFQLSESFKPHLNPSQKWRTCQKLVFGAPSPFGEGWGEAKVSYSKELETKVGIKYPNKRKRF
jgi:hypothetical protein